MRQYNANNLAAYMRKIAIDGYVIAVDNSDIKAMTAEIQKIGVNINQIAKRVNSTSRIYEQDIAEIKGALDEIWRLQKLSLLKARFHTQMQWQTRPYHAKRDNRTKRNFICEKLFAAAPHNID